MTITEHATHTCHKSSKGGEDREQGVARAVMEGGGEITFFPDYGSTFLAMPGGATKFRFSYPTQAPPCENGILLLVSNPLAGKSFISRMATAISPHTHGIAT